MYMAYANADVTGDLTIRKRASGLLCTANGAHNIWRSKLQTIVAQSTTEAVFVAASMAEKQMMWLHTLLWVMQVKRGAITLYCDNY
jgi:hypothetical protein